MNNTDVQMLMKMLMQVICMTWNRSDVKYGWPVYRLLDAILHIPPVIGPVQEGLTCRAVCCRKIELNSASMHSGHLANPIGNLHGQGTSTACGRAVLSAHRKCRRQAG